MAGLKTSLQMRAVQTQTLTMTPQLQQAIRLLQLSTLDLRQEIQLTIEKNPLLEIDESIANSNMDSLDEMAENERRANDSEIFDPFSDDASYQGADIDMSGYNEHNEVASAGELIGKDSESRADYSRSRSEDDYSDYDLTGSKASQEYLDYGSDYRESDVDLSAADDALSNTALPDRLTEAAMDPGAISTLSNHDTLARDDSVSAKSRSKNGITGLNTVYEGETEEDLRDHLTWQLNCSQIRGRDREIAEAIIDAVDDSGYLTESLEDIVSVVIGRYPDTTEEDVAIVLKLVQHFDPLGVASRTVQECLLIQISEMMQTNVSQEVLFAELVVSQYLDMLSNHDYRGLCNQLSIKEDLLKKVIEIIVSLTPRPGNTAVKQKSDFIIPDVLVVKDENGNYDVVLNPDSLPRVRLNEQYKALSCYARNEREKEFFKSNLQEANWFIQSIAKRNDTLLKVSKCIIQHQKAFLDHGESRMEPLVLNDIAREVEMHESTISRVTTEKYLFTSRGTFELKYFFSSHVSTESGGTASSTAIRAEIKSLISKENPRRPYSDNQIAVLLKEKGYCVARRTIAKYRESIGIGSSSQRKRLV